MSEYIVQVPDEQVEQFIARFGIEGTRIFGFQLMDEIVRCKDCELEMNGYCSRPDEEYNNLWFPVEPDGFCAWPERKEARDD